MSFATADADHAAADSTATLTPDTAIDTSEPPAPRPWLIACLCAEWCGTCRGYRAVLEALAQRHADVRCAWIDIEDQSDALGGLDIDDFPTLLIAHHDALRFYGAVLPHAATLDRSLAAARQAPLTGEADMPAGLFAQILALADHCLV